MKYYLYYLTDENDKVHYVGITTNVKRRMNSHKKDKPPHTFELIEHFDNPEDAGLAEQNHIMRHDTFENGWNKTIGGDRFLSDEHHPSYIHGMSGTPEYYRQWEVKWQERNKRRRKEYRKKNRDKISESGKIYYQNNKDRIKANVKKWAANNPEKVKEYKKKNRDKTRHPCLCLFTGMRY